MCVQAKDGERRQLSQNYSLASNQKEIYEQENQCSAKHCFLEKVFIKNRIFSIPFPRKKNQLRKIRLFFLSIDNVEITYIWWITCNVAFWYFFPIHIQTSSTGFILKNRIEKIFLKNHLWFVLPSICSSLVSYFHHCLDKVVEKFLRKDNSNETKIKFNRLSMKWKRTNWHHQLRLYFLFHFSWFQLQIYSNL